MVAGLYAELEWCGLPPRPAGWHVSSSRCLRLMGLWSICPEHTGMVPVTMAAVMGPDQHRCEGAVPLVVATALWGSSWGVHGAVPIGQPGSGGCPISSVCP